MKTNTKEINQTKSTKQTPKTKPKTSHLNNQEILCFACGKSPKILIAIGQNNFCEEHAKQLKNMFLLKCATCGAWGFIPICKKSILYLAESNLENNIAITNYCSNCTISK